MIDVVGTKNCAKAGAYDWWHQSWYRGGGTECLSHQCHVDFDSLWRTGLFFCFAKSGLNVGMTATYLAASLAAVGVKLGANVGFKIWLGLVD